MKYKGVAYKFKVISKMLDSYRKEACKRLNIDMYEYHILQFLLINDDKNTAKDIVEYTLLSKSSISCSVESLTQKGLLKREMDLNDRRIDHLVFTPKAKPYLDEIKRSHDIFWNDLCKDINEEDLDIYFKVLDQMTTNAKGGK